jgi:TldD protein
VPNGPWPLVTSGGFSSTYLAARYAGPLVEPLTLDDADLHAVLTAALGTGADFAEVYAEQRRGRSLELDDRKVEELSSGLDRGAGIRVLRGGQTGYAYTNLLTREALVDAAKVAAAAVSGGAQTTLADLREVRPPVEHPAARDPLAVAGPGLVEIVTIADAAARDVDGSVRQVAITYMDSQRDIVLANSEGHRSSERQVRTRLIARVVAARDGMIQSAHEAPGGAVGHELFDTHPPDQVGRLAAQRAVRMLDAVPAPSGEFTVVLGPGEGGVLFHEASGHGMEADHVTKGASVYAGRQGDVMGAAIVSGVDDATLPGAWGSFGFDDEGEPAQRTVLFDEGVCTDFLTDRIRAAELGLPRSGNGRRQSYAHLPIPRMTNTFILPGADRAPDIIADVRRGVYCDVLGGGQVDPASGEFVFGMTVAYMIESGELTTPLRGANLVGDGPTVLTLVDAIADDLEMRQGVCGKDGQGVPAGLGSPTLRITRMTVGGTA